MNLGGKIELTSAISCQVPGNHVISMPVSSRSLRLMRKAGAPGASKPPELSGKPEAGAKGPLVPARFEQVAVGQKEVPKMEPLVNGNMD